LPTALGYALKTSECVVSFNYAMRTEAISCRSIYIQKQSNNHPKVSVIGSNQPP
jgi:hypothetical protein